MYVIPADVQDDKYSKSRFVHGLSSVLPPRAGFSSVRYRHFVFLPCVPSTSHTTSSSQRRTNFPSVFPKFPQSKQVKTVADPRIRLYTPLINIKYRIECKGLLPPSPYFVMRIPLLGYGMSITPFTTKQLFRCCWFELVD